MSEILEFIEAYEVLGQKVFRFRVKGLNVIISVTEDNKRNALEKAHRIIKEMGLINLSEKS